MHVPLSPCPRSFSPPISGQHKWAALIDHPTANFLAIEVFMFRNKDRCSCRRPKSAKSYSITRLPCWIFFVIRHSDFVILAPAKWFHLKRVRPMRFFFYRGADTIAPKQRAQSRERFIKLLRITQSRFKQSKLL